MYRLSTTCINCFNWRTEFFLYQKFENETIFVPWRLPTRSCWLGTRPWHLPTWWKSTLTTCNGQSKSLQPLVGRGPSLGERIGPSVDGNQKSPRPTHRPWMYKRLLWILGMSTTSIWWCSRISTSPNCEDGSFTTWQTNIGKQSIATKRDTVPIVRIYLSWQHR